MSRITLRWESSEHRAISRQADEEMPVYCITSPSLSGLNLQRIPSQHSEQSSDRLLSLFDSIFSGLPISADGLVNPPVGTAADEAHDFVGVVDLDFAGIAAGGHLWIRWLWRFIKQSASDRCKSSPGEKGSSSEHGES